MSRVDFFFFGWFLAELKRFISIDVKMAERCLPTRDILVSRNRIGS